MTATEPPQDSRMPRGALIVVAIGLLACVVAAVAASDPSSGSAAQLEWVQSKSLPDSTAVLVPGGGGQMQLVEGEIRDTGSNVSGYSLFATAAVLRIDGGSPVGGGRVRCGVKAVSHTEVAQTPDLRASYPRSSEELIEQEVPEVALVEFSSQGSSLAVVELSDLLEDRFATEKGIKVEWPAYRVGNERWEWFLPPGSPAKQLVLPFASVWKTTAIPSARIACTLTTSAGTAAVRTSGGLGKRSQPIAE